MSVPARQAAESGMVAVPLSEMDLDHVGNFMCPLQIIDLVGRDADGEPVPVEDEETDTCES